MEKKDEARKDDSSKLRMDLIPTSLLRHAAQVLTTGAERYGDRNWEKGMNWSRLYGAALRHLTAWWSGEDLDPDDGLHHLAHASCCIAFLLDYTEMHREMDDRPSNKGRVISGCVNLADCTEEIRMYKDEAGVTHFQNASGEDLATAGGEK